MLYVDDIVLTNSNLYLLKETILLFNNFDMKDMVKLIRSLEVHYNSSLGMLGLSKMLHIKCVEKVPNKKLFMQ